MRCLDVKKKFYKQFHYYFMTLINTNAFDLDVFLYYIFFILIYYFFLFVFRYVLKSC